MAAPLTFPSIWGLFLVTLCFRISLQSESVPVRMASDSLIVRDYKKDRDHDFGTSVITLTDDNTEYQIYQGVMGRPGVDFPVHPHIPATSFTCRDIKRSGYYADLETDCQVFHICDGGRKISFICPNGTIFRQSHLICDWWFRVDCGKSVELYEESAEQLAADQKLFRERAEERERRRKLVKTLRGESYKPEIFSIEETRNRPPIYPSTVAPVVRQSEERKPERNSKRVPDANFADYYPNLGSVVHQDNIEHAEISGKLSAAQGRTTTKIIYEPTTTTTTTTTTTKKPEESTRNNKPFVARIQHVFAVDKALFAKPYKKAEDVIVSQEAEKQHLAESASFASHRNGRFFTNLISANQPNIIDATSSPPYKVISSGTSKSVEMGLSLADKSPTKKLEDRLKYATYPTTSSPVYKPTIPHINTISTAATSYPSSRIPIEDIYFTTKEPELKAINATMESFNPDIAISLQELDINKNPVTSTTSSPVFESSTRAGLDVPPSSGPNSLRSFALYFAGPSEIPQREIRHPYFKNNVLIIPLSKEQEQRLSGKSTIKEVDSLVRNATSYPTVPNPTYSTPTASRLPSSLTPQIRYSYNQLFKNDTQATTESPATTTTTSATTIKTEIEAAVNKQDSTKTNNDLFSSQSRGILESDINTNQVDDKISPNLRELAQIFTKALSAYLDDPEAFRKALSEIRPTEPSTGEEPTARPIDYPSATQEEDEVLDFSDVTKPPSKKKTTTALNYETTTESHTEVPTTTTISSSTNAVVLPLLNNILNVSESQYPKPPSVDLTAPPFETLDQSQSSYYTPSPSLPGTTNAIAEEINKEFSQESLPEIDSNEAVDSYFPLSGSVSDPTRPRYGGFQNNTKYSPYGAELTTDRAEVPVTTFNPTKNRTQSLYNKLHLIVNHARQDRQFKVATTTAASPPEIHHQAIQLGNGETLERTIVKTTPKVYITTETPDHFETNPEEINLELSPPAQDLKGFFITQTWNNEPATLFYPTTTAYDDASTTAPPEKVTTQFYVTDTNPPPTSFETVRTEVPTTTTEFITTISTTPRFVKTKTGKSLERLMELQETLMFNTTNTSQLQKEKARAMVEETMKNITMSDMTANTLMKMMELAAKNETYRRLVLLLVNDRSGKNKSVEEARISLLRALLTPVINTKTSFSTEVRSKNFRRGKSNSDFTNRMTTSARRVTTSSPINKTQRIKSSTRPRVVMTTTTPSTPSTTIITSTTQKPSTVIGNLGLIRKTIENSRTKEVRINSLEDAILDSDSRAIELLRSLYSLAARWG